MTLPMATYNKPFVPSLFPYRYLQNKPPHPSHSHPRKAQLKHFLLPGNLNPLFLFRNQPPNHGVTFASYSPSILPLGENSQYR